MHDGYQGPKLEIVVNLIEDTSSSQQYQWRIQMLAPDAQRTRMLGYKASGWFKDSYIEPSDAVIFVHDEDRPVWTPLPNNHRPDIRMAVNRLAKEIQPVLAEL